MEQNDIYLGTYYMSPYSQNNKNLEFFSILNEEIRYFQKKGIVLLQGDLNARTAREKDYIESDKTDMFFGIHNSVDQNERNSEDSKKNPRGNELLDLCKINDILIVNGRKPGDIFGTYTCHNWNGSSVVNYFLSSVHFIDRVSTFTVDEYIPWLSDHCMIKTTILLNSLNRKVRTPEKWMDTHPGFLWNDQSKVRFSKGLKSENNSTKINTLLQSSEVDPLTLAEKLKQFS